MPLSRAYHHIARLLLPAACAAQLHAQAAPAPGAAAAAPTETISIRTSEGTFLAFDIARDGRIVMDLLGEIREIPAGGGDARRLTDAVRDTAEDLDPSYAPDGRRIVFRGERRGRTGLWLLEPGAAAPRQLTQLANPDGLDGGASWSPDGMTIAFARMLPPDGAHQRWRSAIALIAATGRDSARLLRIDSLPTPHARDPAWTPDGRRLAFVAQSARAPRGGRLWIVDAAGGTAAPLSPEGVEALAPAFAPDGRRLAFLAPDSAGRTQVWVQDATAPGAAPARLTAHADVAATRVRWTGDGRAIAYSADGRLWTMSAEGGAPREIRFTAELTIERPKPSLPAAHFAEPGRAEPVRGFTGLALSRDARQVGMLALGKLWVMPAEGGTPRAVADVPPTARTVAWSADGATIAWSAGRAEEEDLFATDVAGGGTRRVTALPGREVFPAFSPDGRHLAFVHGARDGTARLRVIDAAARDVADDSRAATLDSLDLAWTASTADVPVWSPASDGLLRIAGGWGSPTSAVLSHAGGGRRAIAQMPDSPLYLQWLDGVLVFVRHARLWRVPFDSTGPTGPARPLGDDPAMYLSAAADGTLLYLSDGGLRLRAPGGRETRLGWPLSFTPPVPGPLLIRNARIIDGTGAPATEPRDLLVEGGRIRHIDAPGALPSTDSAARDVLDAAGGFVMPGLMDLHQHFYVPALLPAFLYFGVTTVRDQGSPIGPLAAWAEGSAAGAFQGPRVGYGGFQLYSDWAYDTEEGLGVEPEADAAHAARSVALAALLGAQHVKTRTFRRWDINARMVAEAHRRGMRATGHCAHLLPLVAAGMDAQEHAGFCGRRGDGRLYDDFVQLYRAAGIAVVPTVVYSSFAERLTGPELLGRDAELAAFLPGKEAFGWMLELDEEGRRSAARSAQVAREAALRLVRAGVPIGTGTDIWQVPSAVHLELEELVAAGLTPLEAIRAATGDAARILGAADLGTVAVGKIADLVVLDADPVADIRNTRRIRAVVQGGRVVDRERIGEAAGVPRAEPAGRGGVNPAGRTVTGFGSQLERLRTRLRIPGMSAIVMAHDSVLWEGSLGHADLASRTPVTPTTRFHLASLTKTFASTIVLQLVEEGLVDLDAPIADYGIRLPGPDLGVVRVRHLLSHSSEGTPGEQFRYNGDRFALLDQVIRRATGQSFAARLMDRIVAPLGLEGTAPNPLDAAAFAVTGRDAAAWAAGMASGYGIDRRKRTVPVAYPPSFSSAAGLVSTARDVARYSTALDAGRFLREETRALAYTPARGAGGRILPYALGWFVSTVEGHTLVWHYGYWTGNSSLIIKEPARGLTFVVLTNSDQLSAGFRLGAGDLLSSPVARAFVSSFVTGGSVGRRSTR